MAGDLYAMSIEELDLDNIGRAGGTLIKTVQHADRTQAQYYVELDRRVAHGVVRNRVGLPPHCYIEFDAGKMIADRKFSLCRVLMGVSRPIGIVKDRADLRGWDNLADLGRCNMLWNAAQNGPVMLEFYKVGIWNVKDHFRDFEMVDEH